MNETKNEITMEKRTCAFNSLLKMVFVAKTKTAASISSSIEKSCNSFQMEQRQRI